MAHLLVVDDEESICWGLAKLAQEMGHSVETAASAEAGLELARRSRPDAVVLDVRLPGMDGLSAMQHFREALGPVPMIVITAYGQLATAVEAVRNGAMDYLTKPFDLQVAERAVRRALEAATFLPAAPGAPACGPDDDASLPKQPPDGGHEAEIVGTSPAMQKVFNEIALVAATDACVLLRGESGTGKELVARAIHRYSRRSQRPFVAVNLASLSPSLAESELFGHVRGAFTGAEQPRRGLLERADGGTIFLDEIADVPQPLQVKLLRALEHGELLPVGADRPIQSDFRIISASHQDLRRRVAEGSFRHDLYFRLITFEIELPPLGRRREDIPLLAQHFLSMLSEKNDPPGPTQRGRPSVSPEALAELERRPWYGNVRELRNAVERAMIMARGGTIGPEHLPPPVPPAVTSRPFDEAAIASLVREWAQAQLQGESDEADDLYNRLLALVEPPLLEATIDRYHGQCAPAARRLGLHRATLRKKLNQFGIGDG